MSPLILEGLEIGIVALGIQAAFGAAVYELYPLPNTLSLFIKAIAPDAQSAVGSSTDNNVASKAFIWTPQRGVQDLGHLRSFWADAVDVSDNGAVVVGTSSPTGSYAPVLALWTNLSILGIDVGQATGYSISGDGSRVLAKAEKWFLWSSTHGRLDLTETFATVLE